MIISNMDVKIQKLDSNAVIPSYAHITDAGMDLYATSFNIDEYGNHEYGTGLAMEIPKGYVGLLFPRSSICKYALQLSNSVGVIDSGYRGEIKFKFNHINNKKDSKRFYNIGERIGQIIILPYPFINFIESETLDDSDRGEGGFGSSGTN